MTQGFENCIDCERCGARCKVAGPRNPKAGMLRRSKEPKGLCINCAVHDFLRNTYPVNMLLAQSGPKGLLLPHIQEAFAGIMRVSLADAEPDEINWELIIENWNLPFKSKVKATVMNPASQAVLDREPEMQAHQENYFRDKMTARDEGFESLFDKQEAERRRIINDEFLPFMRKLDKQ